MTRRTLLIGLTVGALLSASVLTTSAQNEEADGESFRSTSAKFNGAGELIRPEGWRKWVYIGTPVTPNDMNNGAAAFPEFHNVYIDPDSFTAYEQTGEFPEGTMIAKELVSVGSKAAVSGNGYFMGELQGLEITVKDTKRFADEPGGWAYFSFGHEKTYAKTAKIFPTDKCNACHEASADQDWVFTQYYPILRAADPRNRQPKQAAMKMDDKAQSMADSMLGEKKPIHQDDYSVRLFKWLQQKNYRSFKAESRVHESAAAAAHGDVRAFVNDKLAASMSAGNDKHPIGSFAAKELYKDGTHIGWATMLKVKEDNGDGSGWYWYENLSTTDPSKPVAAGLGAKLCTGCHSSGMDFVRLKEIQ